MQIDFASMNVGDTKQLPPAKWDDVRPLYEECAAYCATFKENRPQFEFQQLQENIFGVHRWEVRRVR